MTEIRNYDDHYNRDHGLESPATGFFLVTPSDTDPLPKVTRALSWSGDGDLRVLMRGKSQPQTIPAGSLATTLMQPLRIEKIFATGTTATGIIGWF